MPEHGFGSCTCESKACSRLSHIFATGYLNRFSSHGTFPSPLDSFCHPRNDINRYSLDHHILLKGCAFLRSAEMICR